MGFMQDLGLQEILASISRKATPYNNKSTSSLLAIEDVYTHMYIVDTQLTSFGVMKLVEFPTAFVPMQ